MYNKSAPQVFLGKNIFYLETFKLEPNNARVEHGRQKIAPFFNPETTMISRKFKAEVVNALCILYCPVLHEPNSKTSIFFTILRWLIIPLKIGRTGKLHPS